jgi:adenine-specific DNA-methyltransferase
MIARIVKATTEPGDIVLDPYMGAGTVAVVARDERRHFLGAETDAKYYSVAMRRLKCEPDSANCFPNLKTLRDYAERTERPADSFRFDVQVGKVATDREKARIYPEEHHLREMEERIEYEESAFSADRRGHERPVDRKLNGNGRPTRRKNEEQAQLFK